MPQFEGSITDKQADAIVSALVLWLHERGGKSVIAAIICDAVHDDITLQPLHDAYARVFHARIVGR